MGAVTDIDEIQANAIAQAQRIREQQNDPAVLVEGFRDLFHRIHAGEALYGIPWREAHDAVRSGRLHETYEVCVWLMDISLLDDMIAES